MEHDLPDFLKNKREMLSNEAQTSKSKSIIEKVAQSSAFKHAQHIGYYHAVRGEADPASITQSKNSKTQHKHFYLPVLSPNPEQGLLFAEITENTLFMPNKFNIPEPIIDECDLLEGQALDLVLMPLLGFDKEGNRLGMGGGFYDRSFAFKKERKTRPHLMGIAYDFQEIDSLTPESWDIGLDYIVTESRFIELIS